MKKYSYLLFLVILVGCNDSSDNFIGLSPSPTGSNPNVEITQFSSVDELLIAVGDFSEGACTFRLISNQGNAPHIQVSNLVNTDHSEKRIAAQVKRNIVFVAFQAFARTDIEEFIITSVPVSTEVGVAPCHYLEKFRVTTSVKRKTAIKILDIYFFSSRFQNLYQYEESIEDWRPNENFRFLQYDVLNEVFNKLAQ